MKNLISLFFIFSIVITAAYFIVAPRHSFADNVSVTQVSPPGPGNSPIIQVEGGSGSVLGLFRNLLKWFATAFWIFAIGFVFYAAYLFLFGATDPKNYDKAKQALLWAVIAIAIGLVAYGLPDFVDSVLRGV